MAYHLISCLLVPFLLLLLLLTCLQTRNKATARLPPGPWKLPIIGNLHQLGSMPHRSLQELSSKHGPLMLLKLGSIQTLVVSSGEVVSEIFRLHDTTFSGRPSLCAARKLSYGCLDMTFAPYGEYWRQVRKVSMQELLSTRQVQSFRSVREEEVGLLVDSVRTASSPPSPVAINLSELALALSNNIICRVVFGDMCGGSSYGEGKSGFHEVLEVTQNLLGGFCIGDFFPWLEWIHEFTGLKKSLDNCFEKLDGFYNQAIEVHLNRKRKEEDGDEIEDLVDVLLRLQKDPNYSDIFSSMNHIKGLLMDMFVAGTDTTSATIVWTMTELVKNPRAMDKVREELQTVIGDKTRVHEGDLKRLSYLKQAIKEALRLHPPSPLLVPRETTQTCTIRGYTIPSRTRVFINAKAIAVDPSSWKNPTKFWPERFQSHEVDFGGQDCELIPFGFGRRGCPGMNFGLASVELALANLLHCFDWNLPLGMDTQDLDLDEAFGLTMHKKNPLRLVAHPRHVC